jgi:hypothetical protein
MAAARSLRRAHCRLDLEYSRTMVFFTWYSFDEMDEVSGLGSEFRLSSLSPQGALSA